MFPRQLGLRKCHRQFPALPSCSPAGPEPLSPFPRAVRQLESYSYPLNIVELQTMVERAATQVGARWRAPSGSCWRHPAPASPWQAQDLMGAACLLKSTPICIVLVPCCPPAGLRLDSIWQPVDRRGVLVCNTGKHSECG